MNTFLNPNAIQNGSIDETRLTLELQTKINNAGETYTAGTNIDITNNVISTTGVATTSRLETHTNDSDIHVRASDKVAWNQKYHKDSNGIPKSDLASSVQASLGLADTALQSHQSMKTINGITLTGTGNVDLSITKAISYMTNSAMISAFNALDKDTYKVGDNIYIVALNVPDLWVMSVENTSVPYSYTTDDAFVNEIRTNGYVQVGYYKLSMLETAKVDLSNYLNTSNFLTLLGANIETWTFTDDNNVTYTKKIIVLN